MSRVDSCGYHPGLELMNAYQGIASLSHEKKKNLCEKLAEINRENTDLSALNNALIEAEAKMKESNGKIKKIDFSENREVRDLIDKVKENHPDLHIGYQFNEATFTSTLTILQNKVENQIHRVNEVMSFLNLAFDEGILYTETMQKTLEMLQRFIESVIATYAPR